MTDLNKLKEKVEALENIAKLEGDHKKDQEQILQEINELLLTEYIIKIGETIIEPLWVEAYYYNESANFTDESIHRSEMQKNNFGKLYFHHKTGDRRSGVDICLSRGEYYLSFLLKYTLVNGEFTTQSQLDNEIRSHYDNQKQILFPQKRFAEIVRNTKRIGITSGQYKDEKLATVRDINKRFICASGEKKSLPNKMATLKEYIEDVYKAEEKSTEEQKRKISKALVGEYWKDLFE